MWRATLKSLLLPGGIVLLSVVVLAYSGWLTLALPALSFLNYCALAGGMLLAWRFHSSRIFFALLVLFLAEQAMALSGIGHIPGTPGWTALRAAAILVPLNFVLIAVMHERGFTASSISPIALFLSVQAVVVAVLVGAADGALPPVRPHHLAATVAFSGYALLAFVFAGVFLVVRFLFTRRPADSAMLWSLFAFCLSLRFTGNIRLATVYAATAACILAVSIIENSYLLAYHDELTTLPSRRAFNDALLRLQDPYSIAVVDIDHFKRFNDTYGHDTGDQVLKLVATRLAQVRGDGQAFRCGGEEFAILFRGRTISEIVSHLEKLRETIESSEFLVRGGERRRNPRGPDRRREAKRGRARKAQAIRQLAQGTPASSLSVTVSIGVAMSSPEKLHPDLVLQSADKALYRAKANGRNRVETESPARRRVRIKAAGIA